MTLTAGSLTLSSDRSSGPCYRTPGDSRPPGPPCSSSRHRSAARSRDDFHHPASSENDACPGWHPRQAFSDRALTDADARRRNEYPHLAPEKFEQDRHATVIGDAFENTLGVGENAVHQPDAVSRTQPGRESQHHEAIAVLARADVVDNPVRDRQRLLAGEHQPIDPEGGMNGTPAVAREIDAHEQVARKQRTPHDLVASRVA